MKASSSGSGPIAAKTAAPPTSVTRSPVTGSRPYRPDLAELADVAEAQLAAVRELQDEPDVRIVGRVGRDHEQLAGHLEVDRERGVARQLDDELLGAPADRQDGPSGDAVGERDRVVRAQRARPRAAGADDRRAHEARAQVARDGLDLGKFRHRAAA